MSCKKTKAHELSLDIEDLSTLMQLAKRQKTKDLLSIEIRKLETELSTIKNNIESEESASSIKAKPTENRCYDVKITNYGWDESDRFTKLYITLNNVQKLAPEFVKCDFDVRSMKLSVFGLEGKNYHLDISNLCGDIIPDKSYTKIKTDMIVIFLAKKVEKTWSHVTGVEKQIQQSKNMKPDVANPSDPESGLMSLMKKMYQEGDDDLKRTIAKAWTESQEKRTSGIPDFPSM